VEVDWVTQGLGQTTVGCGAGSSVSERAGG